MTYWHPDQDTCTAECTAELRYDDETRQRIWNDVRRGFGARGLRPDDHPAVGRWPLSDAFAVLRLAPWRLRVQPGSFMRGEGGELLVWSGAAAEGP